MTQNARTIAFAAAAGSVILLAGAFLFQAIGYPPCHLCLLQRWPHAAAVLIGGLLWLTNRRALCWAGAAATLVTALTGLYHTGVERHFWAGPSTCTSDGVTGLSPEDLLNQIMAAPLIRCDEVAWSLLGLSMASWNAAFSLILCALWVSAARRGAW